MGGGKQFQTSSFICCVEVSRLRKRDRVQVSVYVNPGDFHRTYNQAFAFLLPTWGFVITKSCKIKFTSHPTEAEVEVCSPNFSRSQLCCRGDVSLSAGIIGVIVAVYLPNGNGYHCIRGTSPSLPGSVPPHQPPRS